MSPTSYLAGIAIGSSVAFILALLEIKILRATVKKGCALLSEAVNRILELEERERRTNLLEKELAEARRSNDLLRAELITRPRVYTDPMAVDPHAETEIIASRRAEEGA